MVKPVPAVACATHPPRIKRHTAKPTQAEPAGAARRYPDAII